MTQIRTQIPDEMANRVVTRYGLGSSLADLARDCGLSLYLVRRCLRSAGVPLRPAGYWSTDEETIDRAVAAYLKCGTADEAARLIGCTRKNVLKALDLRSVPRNPPNRKFSEADEKDIAARYVAGETPHNLADVWKCSRATINNIVRRQGVQRRHGGVNALVFTERELDEIEAAWLDLRSCEKVAERMGRSSHGVAKALRVRGIDPAVVRRGHNHPLWKGGRHRAEGYWRVQLRVDDPFIDMANCHGYVLEHRYVVAKTLGRSLTASETVHHIDGDTLNNDIANLQLRWGNHGKHVAMRCGDCGSTNVLAVPLAVTDQNEA